MAGDNKSDTKIVLMSTDLMKLYDVVPSGNIYDHHPITFKDPQECLEMLVDAAIDEEYQEQAGHSKAARVEKQWGELELRLSFFSDALSWQ